MHFSEIAIDSLKNLYQPFGVEVDIMRLDEVHPAVSGNKWFKLKEYLKEAKRQNKKSILTFGGAYSNHIVATAAACKEVGLKSIGIIRGEKPLLVSPTLTDAASYGMDLFFTTRELYKSKIIPEWVWDMHHFNDVYLINEGGYGVPGALGVASILTDKTKGYTHIICACGTGCTLSGLVLAKEHNQQIIGISALKNLTGLHQEINALLPKANQDDFELFHQFHFGGYAKHTKELLTFMNDWFQRTGIPSDFVYTGKTFFATDALINQNYFPPGSRILLIHTGGLQGNRSLTKGTLIF